MIQPGTRVLLQNVKKRFDLSSRKIVRPEKGLACSMELRYAQAHIIL